jgi:hypothetical protein
MEIGKDRGAQRHQDTCSAPKGCDVAGMGRDSQRIEDENEPTFDNSTVRTLVPLPDINLCLSPMSAMLRRRCWRGDGFLSRGARSVDTVDERSIWGNLGPNRAQNGSFGMGKSLPTVSRSLMQRICVLRWLWSLWSWVEGFAIAKLTLNIFGVGSTTSRVEKGSRA